MVWRRETTKQRKEKEKLKKYVGFEKEFDIMSSQCELTVSQAMKFISAYRKHVKRVFRKGKQGENINYIKFSEKERSSVIRCNAEIEGKVVEAIIDLGAEISAMSRG